MAMIHTPNTIKTQIQADISAANAKTGAADTTLHDAVNRLINGFGLGSEEKLLASEYQDYIHDGILELINKVRSVQNENTITFLATSDTHYPAEQTATTEYVSNKASSVLASKASKALAYMLKLDFTAFMGDACIGANTTTPEMLKKQMEDYLSFFDEANSNIPCFLAIGNHDTGIYYHNAQTDGNVHTMTGEYLYNLFTSKSASENTVFGGIENGGYCYRDFPDKKLRVFLLNTSEKLVDLQKDQAMYGSQRVWFANALIDLNSKSDASEWKFLTIAHYPPDYGNTMPLSQLLKAYIEGANFNITDPHQGYYVGDSTNVNVSFSGKNSARFIAHFHGHIHNFLTSRMYVDGSSMSESVRYDGVRVCIPNGQFKRENTYDTVGDRTGISFKEENTYLKTADSVNGTSFVVNVIDPEEELIHSFCFGAGYDRLISYGATKYYRVTYNLTNFESSENAVSIEENTPYSTVLTKASDEHEVKELKVTMGDTDVTDLYYSNGTINIPEVTGDIVITARAKLHENFTNLIPLSEAADSNTVYNNGKGYKENTYISSSGLDGNRSGCYTTGFIPAVKGDVIRLEDVGFVNGEEYSRLCIYNANKEKLVIVNGSTIISINGYNSGYNPIFDENGYLIEFTLDSSYCNDMAFFRICGNHICDDSVITKNEEISYGTPTYKVAYNLNNVTSSSNITSIQQGTAYSTTLTLEDGYELSNIVVAMGGVDVTSTVYSDGVISIPNVTGDIVITANATKQADERNKLFTSIDTDGSIYNGKGYKENTYLSSGSANNKNGVTTTGFIKVSVGDVVYLKNIILTSSDSYSRVAHYDANKTHITTSTVSAYTHNGTSVIIENGNLVNFRIGKEGTEWIRICTSSGITEDSAISVNEKIE